MIADLERALAGRLALDARLAERARTYAGRGRRRRRRCGADGARSTTRRRPTRPSSRCTAPDAVGVLYRITRALAELDLDIRSAKVQTLGPQVVDAFYVRDAERREGRTTPTVLARSSGRCSTRSTE